MNENVMLTGKPSIDRPWMKFYPDVLRGIQVPACTVEQYLSVRAADPNVIAMHYYGVDITWGTVFRKVDATARALQVLGVKQGDQIPVFLRSVPEFIYLLLAAERIGASLLCRDNTLEENIEAVQKANAKVIFVHDFFSKAEIEAYREQTNVNTYVIVPALESGDRAAMPVYLQHSLDALYPDVPARGSDTMMWADFCNMGQRFRGFVPAPVNIDRPLLRAYTSGSTGPSKQVIHSAHSIIGVLAQMNFYGASDKFRPTWLLTILPPALIAVVVSMMLLPLAGGMLLILDPFVDVYDVDLEMMRYRPNNWPLIPMFVEVIRRSKRLPADYDMSHLLAIGAGCEAFNNKQLRNIEEFLKQHNCNLRFTAGYGSSEAGSNATLPMAPFPGWRSQRGRHPTVPVRPGRSLAGQIPASFRHSRGARASRPGQGQRWHSEACPSWENPAPGRPEPCSRSRQTPQQTGHHPRRNSVEPDHRHRERFPAARHGHREALRSLPTVRRTAPAQQS